MCIGKTVAGENDCQGEQLLEKKRVAEILTNLCELIPQSLVSQWSADWTYREGEELSIWNVVALLGGLLPCPEHEGRVHVNGGHATDMAYFFGNHPQLLKIH